MSNKFDQDKARTADQKLHTDPKQDQKGTMDPNKEKTKQQRQGEPETTRTNKP